MRFSLKPLDTFFSILLRSTANAQIYQTIFLVCPNWPRKKKVIKIIVFLHKNEPFGPSDGCQFYLEIAKSSISSKLIEISTRNFHLRVNRRDIVVSNFLFHWNRPTISRNKRFSSSGAPKKLLNAFFFEAWRWIFLKIAQVDCKWPNLWAFFYLIGICQESAAKRFFFLH